MTRPTTGQDARVTTGAELVLSAVAAAGGSVCLANPGTTELGLVAALDRTGQRPVLGLFEGVCAGAADGFGRLRDAPAAVVLHLGPGLGNALANLHNARRAGTPLVCVVGEHATWHRPLDAPLTSDIEAVAGSVSGVVRTATRESLPQDTADVVAASLRGQVATLVLPSDVADADAVGPAPDGGTAGGAGGGRVREPVAADRVEDAAAALRDAGAGGLLLLGGDACRADGLRAAARTSASTGCRVLLETFPARQERGGGLPAPARLPYLPGPAREALAGVTTLVLAGAREPVSFFGYPGQDSHLIPDGARVVPLATRDSAAAAALADLADALDAPAQPDLPDDLRAGARPEVPSGQIDASTLGPLLAAVQPEGCVVVDEGATSTLAYAGAADAAPAHDVLALTGGAIGYGLPAGLGAALAAPDRPVLVVQADGSGLYTPQALWSMAREGADVTVAVASNRAYRILQVETGMAGGDPTTGASAELLDLSRPEVDWVALAGAFGVPGTRASDCETAAEALRRALAEPGPSLVQLDVA